MSILNGQEVLTKAELARMCGITRQGFEGWIGTHAERFPPDGRLEMGNKSIEWWLPVNAQKILEARTP